MSTPIWATTPRAHAPTSRAAVRIRRRLLAVARSMGPGDLSTVALLPEEEWGERSLETTVRRVPAVLAFLLAEAGLAAAYLGDGGALTWVADRAILAQRRRVGRLTAARS